VEPELAAEVSLALLSVAALAAVSVELLSY